jgi:hypothetical protein
MSRSRLSGLTHGPLLTLVLGSASAGLALGLVLGGFGLLVPPSGAEILAMCVASLLLAIGVALDVELPERRAQVPLAWRFTLTPARLGFAWGAYLGSALLTKLVVPAAVYSLLLLAVAQDDMLGAVAICSTYGVARAGTIVAAVVRRGPAASICQTRVTFVGLRERMRWIIFAALAAHFVLCIVEWPY